MKIIFSKSFFSFGISLSKGKKVSEKNKIKAILYLKFLLFEMTSIKMQITENTDYTKCIYFPNSLSILSYTSRFIIGRNLGQI